MAIARYCIFALSLGLSGTAAAREAILIDFGETLAVTPADNPGGPVETALRLAWERSGPPPELDRIPPITRQAVLSVLESRLALTADDLRLQAVPCFAPSYRPMPWLAPKAEKRRALFYQEMAKVACETGLPVAFLDATITHESGYNPWARSLAGAMGMMQLMPATARALGVANPWHPLENLRAGARYLRLQLDRFGRFDLALAAYNAGPERKSLSDGSIPQIPETISYVRAITSNWARMTRLESLQPESEGRYPAAPGAVRSAGYRETSLIQFGRSSLACAD